MNLAYEIEDEIGAISEEVRSPSPELDKIRKRINAGWGFQDGGTGLDDGHQSASAVIVACRIEFNFCWQHDDRARKTCKAVSQGPYV